MSLELRRGDHVKHITHGNGKILGLYSNGKVADVEFVKTTTYVTVQDLFCERVNSAKEKLRRQAEAEKKDLANKKSDEKRNKQEIDLKRQRDEEILKARKAKLIERLKNALESNFLEADKIFKADPDSNLINDEQYRELKSDFVKDWTLRELGVELDVEQASAVAAIDGDIKVTARAGSGKTRTLVTRAIFLQKHCRVASRELLLLAFNKDAVNDMRDRLAKSVESPLPHILTFHKLAYALVQPEEKLVFDDINEESQSREIQRVIDKCLISKEYGHLIKDLMLAHFKDDWEQIVNGGFQMTIGEFLDHRRNLPRESLNGEYVKSLGEKLTANTLFEHDVKYRYERCFPWDDFNYRPDFTIPFKNKGRVINEYFGLQGDADYDDLSDNKRSLWAERPEWKFLEFTSTDITKNGATNFVKTLTGELRKAGVICNQLPEEEIWQRVKIRAIDSFTKAMRNFINRCRKLNLNPENLKEKVDAHRPC
jgi:DNA helicase-4